MGSHDTVTVPGPAATRTGPLPAVDDDVLPPTATFAADVPGLAATVLVESAVSGETTPSAPLLVALAALLSVLVSRLAAHAAMSAPRTNTISSHMRGTRRRPRTSWTSMDIWRTRVAAACRRPPASALL